MDLGGYDGRVDQFGEEWEQALALVAIRGAEVQLRLSRPS